jgi:hypothetical protein
MGRMELNPVSILRAFVAIGFLSLASWAVEPALAADLDTLRREFAGKVAGDGPVEQRIAAVGEAAAVDGKDGSNILLVGLAALGERWENGEAEYAALRKSFDEVNTHLDVMADNYKTRSELQNRLIAADAVRQTEGRVFDTFRDAFANIKDPQVMSTLASVVKKEKSRRAAATLAEGIAANPAITALDASTRLVKEKDPILKAAIFRGWKGRKDDVIIDLASKALTDVDWPVRLSAAQVLAATGDNRAVRPLIDALSREEGRLRDDVRDLLRTLTGQNFDADPEAWRGWYNENRDILEGPAAKSSLFGAFKAREELAEAKGVYGIETRSRRILFIIDTSGSMRDPLTGAKPPEGTATGLTPDEEEEMRSSKIEIAKRELRRAIRALEADAKFNIVSYASHVTRWRPGMVKADQANKNEAYLFVREMTAAGGTFTYGAMQEAFQVGGLGVSDKNYDPAVDTIYLISDGAPTDNDMMKPQPMEPKMILDAVREWNRMGKITIHTVAVDSKAAGGRFVDFMKRLAAEHGGQYTQRE